MCLSSLSWEGAQSSEVTKGTGEVTECLHGVLVNSVCMNSMVANSSPAACQDCTEPYSAGIPPGVCLLPLCCSGILQLVR